MLVAVDIGNSNIVIGFLDGERIIDTYRLTTTTSRTSDEYGISLVQFLSMSSLTVDDVDDVIIASVVPQVMHSFRASIIKYCGVSPIVVGPGIKTGINVRMDDPKSLGADCLVDCVSAYNLYGGPCLVIDMGTATTFNYVDKNGSILNGIVSAGLQTSARALAGNTAQLPEVELGRPSTIKTTNTFTAIQAGLYYGFLGGIERVILECRKEFGDDFTVVTTGGFGRTIEHDSDLIDIYDPDLIFKGMSIIYERNRKNRK